LGAVKVQQTFTSRLKNESDFRNRVFSYCYRLLLEQGEPAKAREILADVEAEVARRAEVERMIEEGQGRGLMDTEEYTSGASHSIAQQAVAAGQQASA
jgi:hypothetical protein